MTLKRHAGQIAAAPSQPNAAHNAVANLQELKAGRQGIDRRNLNFRTAFGKIGDRTICPKRSIRPIEGARPQAGGFTRIDSAI